VLNLDQDFTENRFNAALVIPRDFGRNIEDGRTSPLAMIVDGSNANSAVIALGYAGLITAQFNRTATGLAQPLSIRQKLLYNPEAESVYYMVPGIVALLLTMTTLMLTSMAIVREREQGTLEQVMVTPISTPAFILGKTIPFAILGFVEMSLALAVGILWFGIPFAGSWTLLYGLSLVFLFTTLGVGMFISTVTGTQQQAMFFAWFFSVFTILTSGFFTPIENMPPVVQYLTYLNPLRFFIRIVRGIMMKGAGVDTLYRDIIAMVIYSTIVFSFAWLRFSKRHR
jgi:ABC-2 type transport system permease protein